MDGSTASSRFRSPRTVEQESALVSEAKPRNTKYKDKWAFEIFREWQRMRQFKFRDSEVGSIFKYYDFHLFCNVEDNVSLNLFRTVANKKGGRYPGRTLYGIVCGLKRHLEEVKGAHALNPLDYKDKR